MVLCKFSVLLLTIILCFYVETLYANEPKIVIVGAGASGIAAATKLLQNGLDDVTLLEAENRTGGRVYTTKFGEYLVDLGGQWVHGEKGNVAYELAWPLGLLAHSDKNRYRFLFYTSSGDKPLTTEQENNITDLYFKFDDGEPPFEVEEDQLKSIGDVFKKGLDTYFESNPEVARFKSHLLNFMELVTLSSDPAMSWDDVESGIVWNNEGDRLINWKERGYSTILDILMKRYPNPSEELPIMEKTKLNTVVVKIDYKDTNEKVKVHTNNGEIIEADHVIVTPSLGVLKATHNTLFEPGLSESKKHFIQNFGFGSVAKIYLLFDVPWWHKENTTAYGLDILWTDEDRSKRENNGKEWQLYVFSLIPIEYKPNLLCMWLSGKGAVLMETIPADQLKEDINEILYIFAKDYNVTEPKQILRTQWNSNNNFRGTYSYNSMDAMRNHANRSSLIEPIGAENLKVLFAGEVTDETAFATVHGAISSGWREADRLINFHNKN